MLTHFIKNANKTENNSLYISYSWYIYLICKSSVFQHAYLQQHELKQHFSYLLKVGMHQLWHEMLF